jgi:tripartite ATP-independent transporter DctM subunit
MTVFIFLGSLLAAMAIGVPIAYALLVSGVALMWHLDLFDAQILAQNVINGADSFPLLAVPFFMLAGEIMNVGGLSQRIVRLALVLVGHRRGGLGFVAILAACLLAALSGSAVADTAALAALLLPMMVKAGHDKARAGGLIASAGIIAPVIPPSIGFVVFGVAANVSISKLFLAGIVPGLLMGLAIAVTWYWVSQRENVTPPPKASRAEKLQALKESTWALFLPVIVIVGLKMGVFTPTEAAAVAAVYALLVATLVYRELHWRQLTDVFISAAKTTAVIMFLVAAAMVSAWLITVADIPRQLVVLLKPLMEHPTLQPFMDNKILLMAAIMVLVMAVGTAMDMTPTILILTPVLMPVVKAAGIDPVYFGVLFIMNNAIGLITPPVGTVLNVVAGVGKMRMDEVTRGVIPFMAAQFAMMFLMVLFPSIVLVPMRWFIG